MEKTFIDLDLIDLNLDAKDKKEALKILSDKLSKKGKVKASFFNAVLDREKKFPTGLKTKFISFALPHTDSEHVNSEGIAVGLLKKPVKFKSMENPDNNLNVSLIVLLAVKDKSKQVLVLQNLIKMMQNKKTTQNLLRSGNKKELLKLFQNNLFEKNK
jgi:PTS system galactitol-specific IIA component